jgi:hypothetical protein
MMLKMRIWIGCMLVALVVVGCGPASGGPAAGIAGVRAWFDAPLPETVYWPPNPCQIVAHGGSPAGIAAFELEVNGAASTVPSPETKSSLATLTRDCGLSLPGRYLLRVRAQDNGGNWSGYAETSLIIEARGPTTPAAPPPPAPPPLVIASATSPLPGGVSIESVETWVVYAGDATCGPNDVVITARATAPKGIQVVVLFYRYEPGSPSGFLDVAMNPIGGDLYRASLIPNSTLGGPADGIVQYQVVVQQNDGDNSLRTPVFSDIAVQACSPADNSGGTDACSAFADQRTCIAKGCNWWEIPGTPPSFACRSRP